MAVISLAVVVVAITVYLIIKKIESVQKNKAFASASKLPGPKGLPIIGSVHELPEKCSWMKFAEWADEYGPIYQVNLAGHNHVWIARDKIAHDLLSKRSAIYSDRPFIPALEHDNRTSGQYLPLMSKNLVWSRQRRFAKQIMDVSEKQNFYSYPEIEATRLLFEMMSDPSQYNVAMESFVARVTSRLAWGTPAASDELKQRARELLIGVSPSGALGNKIPAIMSLPENMVKAKAWELRRGRTEKKFFEIMQEEVRQSVEREEDTSTSLLPTVQPKQSWTRMYLEHSKSWGFSSDTEGAYAVGMHGIAGALTIAAPMQSFCLAMCHYPQYQSVLHEEIDRVLGDRMPTFDDMPEMPVLRAFIRETLRWRPPVPTGIPHEVTQDDVYEGYHIPKGSVIHPLEWSISRDPAVFPEPDDWNPMRWLHSDYPTYEEPLTRYPTITQYSQFGYGRRTCQGMGVTEADLFVSLGSVAWLFSMQADDETAVKTEAQPEPQQQAQPQAEPEAPVDDTFSEIDSIGAPSTPMSRRSTFFSNDAPADLISFENEAAGDWSPSTNPKRLSMHLNDSAISLFNSDYPASDGSHGHSRQSTLQNQLSIHDNDSAISVASFASDDESMGDLRKEAPRRPRLVPKDSGISMSSFIAQRESRPSSRKSTLRPRPASLRIHDAKSVSSLISEMHNVSTSRQNSVYTPGSALSLLSEMADEQGGWSVSRQNSMHFPEPASPAKEDSNIRVAGEWPGLSTDPEKEYVDLFGPLIDEPEPALPPVDGPTLTPDLPGAWNFAKVDVEEAPKPKKQAPLYETDPTYNFSTLLIAKPMPFKFKLTIRNQARAEMVARQWIDRKLEGEYQEAKVYWKNGTQGDAEHGWGETFS